MGQDPTRFVLQCTPRHWLHASRCGGRSEAAHASHRRRTKRSCLSLNLGTFTGSRNGNVYRILRLSGHLQQQHGRGFGGCSRTRLRPTDPRSGRMGWKSNLLDGLANWNRRLLHRLLHCVRRAVRLEARLPAIGVHITTDLLSPKLHTQLPPRAIPISSKI